MDQGYYFLKAWQRPYYIFSKHHIRARRIIFHHYFQLQQLEKQITEMPSAVLNSQPPRSLLQAKKALLLF